MAYDYYGTQNNGTTGWNSDLSAFKPGGITDANQSGLFGAEFYNGTDGIASNAGSSVNGLANGQIGGGGGMGGLLDSTSVGPNGQQTTTQGWGGLAMGLGQMYMNWTQGKAQQEMGEEQLDFAKEQFYKNYAMNMDKYRRRVNRENAGLAHAGTGGAWSDTAKNYNTGAAIIDENGMTEADPTYGPVAASPAAVGAAQNSRFSTVAGMAPTIAGISPTANALLSRGTGADSVGVDAESKRKSSPASDKDQYQGAREDESAAVEESTKRKKKLS